ncbi:MAG: MtrB/PioB family decaheme-associated outer membrane protein [Alphaproteobacteria bacterium]
MSRKASWYLSVAAICLMPVAAAAEDKPAQDQSQEPSMEGDKGAGGAAAGGEFSLEGMTAAEERQEPSWETQAALEYTSEVELGILYNTGNSFKHGEYTGLTENSPYAIGNFDVRLLSPYDSKDTDYVKMEGSNIGLDSREVMIEAGRQGSFGGYVHYNQIPKFLDDTSQTPFNNAGSTFQTLPHNWVGSGTTGNMTALIQDLKPVDLNYDRKQAGAGFTYNFAPNWEFKTDYQHEWKSGAKSVGAVIGNSGGNPRSVILAEPIDYMTDQATVAVSYADQRMQGELSYYMSVFQNEDSSLTWRIPFNNIAGWDAPVGYGNPNGFGRLGLPPDNSFHQINFSGGYNIDPPTRTRVNLDLSHGWMLQNQDFLPYTVNPQLTINTPLPRNSLDGKIDTTLVNLRLTSHPTSDIHLRGGYRYDDRDNQTPIDLYRYIGADSTNQTADPASDRNRYNRPYSYTQNKADIEGDYDFMPHTTGTLGYEFENIHRTFSEVSNTNEHTGLARFKTMPVDFVTLKGNVSYGARNGGAYDFPVPFYNGFSAEHIAAEDISVSWESVPALRKYYEADRNRTRFGADLILTPLDNVSFGFRGDFIRDKYPQSEIGLVRRDSDSYSIDVSYTPMNAVTAYAFYNLNLIENDQIGRSISGSSDAVKYNNSLDPTRDWYVNEADRIHTAGVGVDWKVIENTFDVAFDYTYSMAITDYSFFQGPALTSAAIPTITTRFHSAGMLGTYNMRKDIALKFGYRFESFSTHDWAVDQEGYKSLANELTLFDSSPDYVDHIIAASVAFKF